MFKKIQHSRSDFVSSNTFESFAVCVCVCEQHSVFIRQKLRQIDQMKQQQAEGGQLELNQVI